MLLALLFLTSLDGTLASSDPGGGGSALRQPAILLEGELAGYVPGATGAGLLLGGRTASGVTLGVTFGLGTQALSVGGDDQFRTVWGFGAAARARLLATDDDKVTLEVAVDVRLARNAPNGRMSSPPSTVAPAALVTGNGFVLAGGPTLTYWIHPRVGVGYTPRLTFLSTSDTAGGVSRVSLMNVLHVVLTF